MKSGTELINYKVYVMDKRERVKYMLQAAAALFAVGYVFFSNIIIALIFSSAAFLYPKYKSKELAQERRAELNLQFKDALYSLSSSLSSGRSLESGIRAALSDLRVLYSDDNTYIIKEFEYIYRKMELNEPIETAMFDFAERSGLEDIRNFADVMSICKRSGGNLVQVVKNTSNIISDKIEIRQDIDLLLTKQKYEQKLLNIMPLVFIALIKFGGSGYMDSLYTSIKGYLLMGAALGILVISYAASQKIFQIKV